MSCSLARHVAITLVATVALSLASQAYAQTFGVEAHNTLMPAAGGMAGASIARPQDATSAINGNPATLTQFQGTQFIFGGAWAEPTFNLTQNSSIPLLDVDPYSAKSSAPGEPGGNIGVTQEFLAWGMPVTLGLGFVTTSGGAIDYRFEPDSNGTNVSLAIFSAPIAVGMEVTDRLSLGASLAMGIAFFDGPFVGAGGMTVDYALRGTLGADYDLTETTNVGAYYQTAQHFEFDDAIRFTNDFYRDIRMDLPPNIGFGIANNSLAGGCLLVAVDVLYKEWNEADLFKAVYNNQWVVQFGTQYTSGRYKLRAGYAWAQDPLQYTPDTTIGGIVPPGGLPSARYTQALLAFTSQHRITAGIGVTDVLPGVDLDIMAGGMFRDTAQEGPDTTTSVAGYWAGFGLTWRFDNCAMIPACTGE